MKFFWRENWWRGAQQTGWWLFSVSENSFEHCHSQTCIVAGIYTTKKKQATIALVQAGSSIVAVAEASGIHERTIRKWLAAAKGGRSLAAARPGPKPFLPEEADQHLFDWTVGRQLVGRPIGRSDIIRKTQEVALLCSGKHIGEEWYNRFKERYPSLTGRSAQSLASKRNCIVSDDLTTLFNTVAKLIIEKKLDHTRVFNKDETAFQKQLASKKVVAVRESSNVWTTEPTTNFHLTVVACGNAAGFVVPPVFILPGKTVSSQVMANCGIPGVAVTTSPSGFMNMELFEEWLHFFSWSVPASIPRPLVLILDGCIYRYSAKVVDAADALDILLVFLPPNGTHLLQPLDVAVFATLKSKIHNMISELGEEDDNGYFNISKDDAIKVASLAWGGATIGRNLERGFKACGLFPLSLVKMRARLDTFTRNGAPRREQLAA